MADDSSALRQFVRYREEYVSRALNSKFSGITPPGVYWGFECAPGGGMTVAVSAGGDFPESVAVVDRDGYSITVKASDAATVDITGSGTWWICLEAYYSPGQDGYQRIVARQTPEEHHVRLAKITVPDGAAELTAGMFDDSEADTGNPALIMANFLASIVALTAENIDMKARITNLEHFLETNHAYDPEMVY